MVMSIVRRTKRVRLARIGLGASALAAVALPVKFATPGEAKTPGSTYCYHGTCHRVKTIAETQALVGVEETIYASYYDDCKRDRYNPCGLTSSGERFHPDRPDNTASPIYPDGTTLLVWSPETERALVVRVNNAGPYWGNRLLDLSHAAAERLGFEGKGVAKVKVRVIKAPYPQEAKYVHNRTYPPVPGDIGTYASLEQAQTGMAVALALQASAASPLAPVTTANAFAGQGEDGPLVAEAPQTLGRGSVQVAARVPSTTYVPLFGPDDSNSRKLPQSHRRVASLSWEGELDHSPWDGEPLDEAPDVADSEPAARDVEAEPAPAQKTPVAKTQTRRAHKHAARGKTKNERHARSSRARKSHARNKRRSRRADARRHARPRRSTRLAYSEERIIPRVRERSAGQLMSLGIRAKSSSTM